VTIVPSNSLDVELRGITSRFGSVDSVSSRKSFSKDFSELGLGPTNIIVLRKIPKNTEPKIEVVTIKIDLADNYNSCFIHT